MGDGREVWAQRVRRLEESELTTAEFAAELGINPRTLTYWKWRLGKEQRAELPRPPTAKSSPAFVEVKPDQAVVVSTPIEIVLDARVVVRVTRDFDPEVLRRVVATLVSGVT
jgi:transposase-like protein